ncbi:MAG: peptidoglycan-binding protein [Candidatus Pacebacteria bacterium]|nr:peptidoglycan-binding protein [Candidatus Paceibacterota bacterium]
MKKISVAVLLSVLLLTGAQTAEAISLSSFFSMFKNTGQAPASSLGASVINSSSGYSTNNATATSTATTSSTTTAPSTTTATTNTNTGATATTQSASTTTISEPTTTSSNTTTSTTASTTQNTATTTTTPTHTTSYSVTTDTTSIAPTATTTTAATTTSSTTTATPTVTNTTTTRAVIMPASLGQSGANVWAIQNVLIKKGYLKAEASGYYGRQTATAVAQFQKDNGLTALGRVGPGTSALLNTTTNTIAVDAVPSYDPVTSGSGLQISRNTAYGDQTIAPGSAHYRVGSYNVKNLSSTETVTLTGFTVGFTGLSSTTYSQLSNISATVNAVVVGPTIATLPSTYMVGIPFTSTLAPSATVVVDLYADVSTTATSSFRSNLIAWGTGSTGAHYGTHGSASYSGQAMYIGGGCSGTALSTRVAGPNGGEVYTVGGTMHITWNTCGHATTAPVHIGIRDSRYSPHLGSGEAGIIATTNTGSYTWSIPATLDSLSGGSIGGTSVYTIVIYVSGGGPSTHFDESDARFTINPLTSSCTINSLTAYPSTISSGSTSMLAWATTGCHAVEITNGPGTTVSVSPSGTRVVGPLYATTTYTMTAVGTTGGPVTATVTVNVGPSACIVTSFIATPSTISSGSSSTLSWSTTGCTSMAIVSSAGPFSAPSVLSGSTSTGPLSATTIYTITATNGTTSMTRLVTVTVTGTTTGWVQQIGSGVRPWRAIATSSDRTKIVAGENGGYLHTSTDSGVTWVQRTAPGFGHWTAVTSSSDGMKLAAVNLFSSSIYTSTDGGVTWVPHALPVSGWGAIASSSDGMKLAASAGSTSGGSYIYTSSDGGSTWAAQTGSGINYWTGISMSGDGTKLIAGTNPTVGGYVYTSADGGVTWTARTGPGLHNWQSQSVAYSSDGTKIIAAPFDHGFSSYIYTSADGGATWTIRTGAGSRPWGAVTSSFDGTKLAAADFIGYIYTSTDSGATWTTETAAGSRQWFGIKSSSDGMKLVAGDNTPGNIWTKN